MPGSPDTRPAPELPRERRLALVIATEAYEDPSLRRLRSPGRDAEDLRGVLADPGIGGFTVTSVKDGTAHEVRVAVGDFLADRSPEDLVLVYLSCHGLVDLRRRLYFAARDTTKGRLAATGVEAQWLLAQLEDCRARRQVLVLDCCFSGAFATSHKGDDDLGLGETFLGQGRGRVVLTASRGSEYSFEGEPVEGQAVAGSVFTHALVEGIRSGMADLDRDGYVSVDDAYGYAFDHLQASGAKQTPQRWLYGAEGAILLARSPAGVTITPAEVPDGITSSLDSSYPQVRIGGVDALASWLTDHDPARVLAAEQTLTQVAEHDRPEVAARAREHLVAHGRGEGGAEGSGPPGRPSAARPASEVAGAPSRDLSERLSRPDPGRPWHTSAPARYGAAGLVAVLGIATAAFLWDRQSSERDGGTSSTGTTSGSHTAQGPWRFEVHDQISGNDVGCRVTLKQDGSDVKVVPDALYGVHSYQIPQTGTFQWTVSDPACLVVTRGGSGSAQPPVSFAAYRGDTDAFRVAGPVTVEVQDWQGGEECLLKLRDPTDTNAASALDIQTATRKQPTVVLDPGGRDSVFLADLPCGVRVSP